MDCLNKSPLSHLTSLNTNLFVLWKKNKTKTKNSARQRATQNTRYLSSVLALPSNLENLDKSFQFLILLICTSFSIRANTSFSLVYLAQKLCHLIYCILQMYFRVNVIRKRISKVNGKNNQFHNCSLYKLEYFKNIKKMRYVQKFYFYFCWVG